MIVVIVVIRVPDVQLARKLKQWCVCVCVSLKANIEMLREEPSLKDIVPPRFNLLKRWEFL